MSNIQSAELWVSEQGNESEFLSNLINARHLSARQSHNICCTVPSFQNPPLKRPLFCVLDAKNYDKNLYYRNKFLGDGSAV